MRCKSCDYALWNLTARQCPECGTGFKPTDFEFTLNSVQFRCPHCSQPYYGTGTKGHLVPRAFTCVSCNTPIDMDEMVLIPTDGLHEDQTKADEMPWLARKKIGFFAAFFRTMGRGMAGPAPLIRLTPVASSSLDALFYTTISQTIINGFSYGSMILIFGGFTMFNGGAGGGGGGIFTATLAGTLLAAIVGAVIFAVVWTLLVHLTLKITGPTQAGLGRTLQAVSYSSGCNIISAVPCLGFYLGPLGFLWWAIAAIFMIRDGQKVSGLRASIAVLWFPLFLMAAFFALMIWGFNVAQKAQATFAASQAASATTPIIETASSSGQMATAIKEFRLAKGRYPDHALELITFGGVTIEHFATKPGGAFGMSDTSSYRFQGIPFDEISSMPNDRVQFIASASAKNITDPSGDHRVGDFVFFWKDVDPASEPQGIWVFAITPPVGTPSPHTFTVGLADGSTHTLTDSEFTIAFIQQNVARTNQGLPTIPDPRLVTDESPTPPE